MNKQQKEVLQSQLNDEKAILKALESNYKDALDEINSKIEILMARQDADMQHVIYQKQYQEALKTQIQAILETLQANEFETVSEYLAKSYEEGFLGTMYDLQGQGIPLVFPLDQAQVLDAIQTETKLSTDLYSAMGKDIKDLQKKIAGEISRGLTTGMMYSEIARNIAGWARIPKNNAMRIARTEAHRIQCKAAYDAQHKAKSKGADIVKQWDATLDGKTRDSHRAIDGEVKELDETFSNGLEYPGDPHGAAGEVINCRCALLQKARWALERTETKYLGKMDGMTDEELKPLADKLHMSVDELRTYQGQIVPINARNYEDFKEKYKQIWNYEGSDLQKQAEARIAGYKSERVRLSAQKMNMASNSTSIDWGAKGTKISNEQYKDLMTYARGKGIELSGFKHFDGDIQSIKELIDDAQSVAKLYPGITSGRKKLTIALDEMMSNDDFAKTVGHVVSINANAYRNVTRLAAEYQKLVDAGWFVNGTDYHAIIKHEIGHVIANTYGIDALELAKKITGIKTNAELLDYVGSNISEYASAFADGREIISECFASAYNSTIINDFALNFVEECVKIIKNM